jgi:hypothetical protein
MSVQKEFIVDIIKKYDNYAGFQNVISYIQARWKLTHPQYPNGFTYHLFTRKLDLSSLNNETFKPIDQVTNEEMEVWCLEGITTTQRLEILNQAIDPIMYSHEINSMTTYYTNPDLPTGMG